MKISFVAFLVVALVLCSSFMETSMAARLPTPTPSFCGSKCAARCSKAGMKDRCLKYCGICCRQCSCVPSGTYGNKSQCPCYRDMKNAKGKSKCP